MNVPFSEIVTAMMRYNAGDPKRIQHALKVYAYAALIGEREGLDERRLAALKAAAALHDIGIHNCETKYAPRQAATRSWKARRSRASCLRRSACRRTSSGASVFSSATTTRIPGWTVRITGSCWKPTSL